MIDFTARDRKRLTDLLGKLGSDHPGERDAAATMIEKFRHEHDFIWPDLIGSTTPQKQEAPLPYTQRYTVRYQGIEIAFNSHADAQRFLAMLTLIRSQIVPPAPRPPLLRHYSVGFWLGVLVMAGLGWTGAWVFFLIFGAVMIILS